MQIALEADPGYRLAKLSDQLLSFGMLAGWKMDKDTAYRTRGWDDAGQAAWVTSTPWLEALSGARMLSL